MFTKIIQKENRYDSFIYAKKYKVLDAEIEYVIEGSNRINLKKVFYENMLENIFMN